jgi:phenylalanyl-tRNA synthetase beta chain
MKISLNWLKEYIDYKGTADELSLILTKAGLEVEGAEKKGTGIEQVIIGKVKAKIKHPDADTLSICTVFDGKEDLQIVCGAPNVNVGQTIALAPIGCNLPTPDKVGFKIKKSKIRGVESFGMICAEDELGLSEDHDGIMILNDSFQAGQNFCAAFNLPWETLEISITPNRADCLSYFGVAQEIAAATGLKIKKPNTDYKEDAIFSSKTFATVEIKDTACSRYMGAGVKNIKIGPSPKWIKEALESSGVRSINNVVDITNFVMLETGNPLHAFDADDIKGKKITVRRAKDQENMTTLDNQKRNLINSDLLICDESGPVALAGIMGGLNSEIKDSTTNVFIEAAYFLPAVVRKTAKRLGIQSDSSYRFERGVDPNRLEYTIKRTLSLLEKYASGNCASDIIDLYPHPIKPCVVELRTSRTNKLLGISLSDLEITKSLASIGLKLVSSITDKNSFEIPTCRHDITREVDLIEEVARLIGFENIPYTTPSVNIKPLVQSPIIDFTNKVKEAFVANGFNETISFHFTGLKDIKNLGLIEQDPRKNPISLKNPIVEDFSHMQTTLIPNLLRAVKLNSNHFNEDIQLFETGRIYLRPENAENFKNIFCNRYYKIHEYVKDATDRPIERCQVAGVLTGNKSDKSWNQEAVKQDFYSVKGVLFSILQSLKIKDIQFTGLREIDTFLHPGKSALILSGNIALGVFGQLSPQVTKSYDLKESPFVFELDVATLMRISQKTVRFQTISKYPAVNRDLSFAFQKSITWQQIQTSINKLNIKNLISTNVFDKFEGGNLSSEQKSLAISLVFQSHEKTLEENDTQKGVDKVVEQLIKEFAAVQR